MGRQSHQRLSNERRSKQLASKTTLRTGDLRKYTLLKSFNSAKHCTRCINIAVRKAEQNTTGKATTTLHKKSHHILCSQNTKTLGKGILFVAQLAQKEDDARYKQLTHPIQPNERGNFVTQAGIAQLFQHYHSAP